MECLTCKKHYSQSGSCIAEKKNCLLYEHEPRGKMCRTTLTFKLINNAETSIIKYNSKVNFIEKGRTIEMTIIKINWINLKEMTCNVDAQYHEKEKPYFEKMKMFKVVR